MKPMSPETPLPLALDPVGVPNAPLTPLRPDMGYPVAPEDDPLPPNNEAAFTYVQQVLTPERIQYYRETRPREKKEFIDGQVVVQSPTSLDHAFARYRLGCLLGGFVRKQKLGVYIDETINVAFPESNLVPDICLWLPPKADRIRLRDSVFIPPDFTVEVLSPKTKDRDLGKKFRIYEANGVREYWIIDPLEHEIKQYYSDHKQYQLWVTAKPPSYLTSILLPGFSFLVESLFSEEAFDVECDRWEAHIREEGYRKGLKEGHEKGEQVGIEKGEEIGIKKGKTEQIIASILALHDRHQFDAETIANTFQLSLYFVESVLQQHRGWKR